MDWPYFFERSVAAARFSQKNMARDEPDNEIPERGAAG
jgi:hypothetical protein